jgi:hypothetical protein
MTTEQPQPRRVVFALLNGRRVPIYSDDTEGIRRLIAMGAHINRPATLEREP